MNSKNFSANGLRGLVKGAITPVPTNGNVARYVPLKARSCLENKLVSSLHVKASPTIMVKIPMRIPSDVDKNNVFLKELRTNEEALEEISTQNGPFNFYSNSMSSCVSQ